MSMEDLFGSGSDSDVSDSGRKLSVASGAGIADGGDSSGAEDELPSTQAHMDELFAESDDNDSNRSKNSGGDGSNNSSPSHNSDSDKEEDEGEGSKRQHGEDDLLFGENNEETEGKGDDDDRIIPNLSSSDDDDDDDIVTGTKKVKDDVNESMPTTQDLFGEELDVSSDEDDDNNSQLRTDATKDTSKYDEDKNVDDDERPPTPTKGDIADEAEEEEGLSISIELPRCNIALGKELYFIKLPNFLSVDTKPFDTNLYEDEIEEDEILDEEGRARLKLKVENTIRWRYSKDKDGNEIKESNCRFVRWSDGSLSMHLGNEVFDVFKMPVQGEQNHLFVQQGTGLQAQAVFKNKLTFRPHSTASQTHRKMTMSIADRMSKAQKIKMMPATERDPESQRDTLIKKEDERMRAANRRESQQRRIREKNHLKGLTSNYLEDDDEDLEGDLSAISNSYKQSVKDARSRSFREVYGEESEESAESEKEEKLQRAKLDLQSDDDDEELDAELRQKRDELARKKKSSRKVIVESDDEDSD